MMGEEKKSRGVKRIGGLRRSRGVEEWRLSGVYSSAGLRGFIRAIVGGRSRVGWETEAMNVTPGRYGLTWYMQGIDTLHNGW